MDRAFKIGYKFVVILFAVLAAVVLSAIVLLAIGADVGDAFYNICIVPLTRFGHIQEVLLRAIPLCIVALGISIAYRSGIINIGAEGQMAIGVLAFTAVALNLEGLPKAVHLPVALLAAIIGGACWGFIPGILKAKLKVSELLSTVMLNYIAAQLYSLCLRTIFMDPAEKMGGTGSPMSKRLANSVFLSRFGITTVHTGIVIALVLAAFVWILMWKTTTGYKMRAAGSGARAARYGGISVSFYVALAITISGAFAGLAGAVEVAGYHHRAIEGVTNGYGFAGVVVALFGGLHPVGIIPASFFFGLMKYGVTRAASVLRVPANMVDVIQGITILVIVTAQMVLSNTYLEDRIYRRLQKSINKKKEILG